MSTSPQRVSDAESSEKPVREKLRNASIAQSNKDIVDEAAPPISNITAVESNGIAPAQDDSARGRPSRKRSHEDITDATQDEPALKSRHGRKRSRETVDEDKDETSTKRKSSEEYEVDTANTNGTVKNTVPQRQLSSNHKRPASPTAEEDRTAAATDTTSPKTKKSRPDEKVSTSTEGTETEQASNDKIGEPSEDKPKTTAIPSTSGFANFSAASPFSALAGSKSPTEQPASASAFNASAFGSLSAASTSGFGSLAGPGAKLSSFASATPTPSPAATDAEKTENDKPASTKTFGGALGSASPFATAGSAFASASAFGGGSNSGFGSAGKGFGSGSGLGAGFGSIGSSKLGSFASTGTPGVIGGASKPAKPFGASADDDEADGGSGGEEDDGAEAAAKADDDEKDERFFERDIETGEENETTEYTCRAKLYNFVKTEDGTRKEWKERGLGVVRLNVANPGLGDSATAPKARLVMRADGSHRVALNTPVVKGVKFGSVTGEPPVGGYMYFMGSIDGSAKLELLQMKLRPQFALELYDRIADLQKAM